MRDISIRAFVPDDRSRVADLEARVPQYLREHEPLVHEMFARAAEAERTGDHRWLAPTDSDHRPYWDQCIALWLAEHDRVAPVLAGVAGVAPFEGLDLPPTLDMRRRWLASGEVAELRHLRVLPEMQRQGVATSLCETLIDWSRDQGFASLVVNTTTPQTSALALYEKLGFRRAGLSFVGRYELVWLELPL